jgi:CheY-like chemotaxis protein
MAKVLHVARNEAVIATRQAILERAGCEFVSARDMREVLAACKAGTFDVLILGHALPPMEKRRIRHTLLEHCRDAKVIECHVSFTPDISDAHAHLQVGATSPESLIAVVKRLTAASSSQKV